ncbi:FMN-dependent NADH-azoreductase [Bremerella alba]|uniref:FMN dependent NADH:quinone oxidoreductase n=1 Tax=Bremerella alba TaxID=980252 RepID=A0A7V8V1D1_9BACT|nr:NAD(P)H-dependent oxidoreductase [Bremerella alba]MBA2113157.1 FMN-dependent NADH-azoreductase 1 [Bremerella alba]
MSRILLIEASARKTRSLSRNLAERFAAAWLSHAPSDEIIRRDVGLNPPPAITEQWIAAVFKPEEARDASDKQVLTLSDELIGELIPADILVIATPMYNYGMPAALKAWFDQVIRINKTFSFDLARGDNPIEPMQSGKTLVMLTAAGEGGLLDSIASHKNHLHPHIIEASRLLGVEQHETVAIEFQEFGDQRFDHSQAQATAAIEPLVERLMEQTTCSSR